MKGTPKEAWTIAAAFNLTRKGKHADKPLFKALESAETTVRSQEMFLQLFDECERENLLVLVRNFSRANEAVKVLARDALMLASVPRCIFIMTRASKDETSDLVCWFNPKNSNGAHAARSAWHRTSTGFTPAEGFDWEEFDKPPEKRKTVTLEHLREVFANGSKKLELKDAAHALATLAELNEKSAYNALSKTGKFADHLTREGRFLSFKE